MLLEYFFHGKTLRRFTDPQCPHNVPVSNEMYVDIGFEQGFAQDSD